LIAEYRHHRNHIKKAAEVYRQATDSSPGSAVSAVKNADFSTISQRKTGKGAAQ
jgi:hypothetical protein